MITPSTIDPIQLPGKPPLVFDMSTMNGVFDKYMADYLPTLAERTQYEYRYLVPVLRQHFGAMVPGELKPKHVGRFLDVREKRQQRNKLVSLLSSIMGLAIGAWFVDDCETNPCANVIRHPAPPRTRYVSNVEFAAVREFVPFGFQLAMDLALLLGQRQGDLLSLTWHQIDDGLIHLTQGKTGKQIGIRLTDAVAEVLIRARRQPPAMPRWHVIRREDGLPYSHQGFRSAWNQWMNRAVKKGVLTERFHFHDLRAKCASEKESLEDASALLGHSNIGLTKRVYIRNMTIVEPLR